MTVIINGQTLDEVQEQDLIDALSAAINHATYEPAKERFKALALMVDPNFW